MNKNVKYPKIIVQLSGRNGNAYAIMGRVLAALKKNKVPTEKIEEFMDEARSGDYDNVIQTCMRWVNVE